MGKISTKWAFLAILALWIGGTTVQPVQAFDQGLAAIGLSVGILGSVIHWVEYVSLVKQCAESQESVDDWRDFAQHIAWMLPVSPVHEAGLGKTIHDAEAKLAEKKRDYEEKAPGYWQKTKRFGLLAFCSGAYVFAKQYGVIA
ncbi:MAG: hypothetical protein WCE21_01010 [Candidatus Babeliales bacterium]